MRCSWAWGMGHGAWGMGHGAWGIGRVPYFPENRYRYLQRMCEVISHNWHKSAPEIKEAVIAEVGDIQPIPG
jgi:hypothetical protein